MSAHPSLAQTPPRLPVCVASVTDDSGRPDDELARAFRAAVSLLVRSELAWRFADPPGACGAGPQVRFFGHRAPDTNFTVEVQLPGAPTESLSVTSAGPIGPFALAEALSVNAMLLLGEPLPPATLPQSTVRLWLAPTLTVGNDIRVIGSELGVRWFTWKNLWVAVALGLEGLGSGANEAGRYQYSVLQTAVRGGWRWMFDRVGISAGLGLRERTWLSHLQTQTLHDDLDFDFAVDSELRVSVRTARALQLGVVARPSVGLGDVSVAAPGEPTLLRVPRFLFQLALEVAIDL